MNGMSATWHQFSKEEQDALTEERRAKLTERNKNRATAAHNVPLANYQDTRTTFSTLRDEVRAPSPSLAKY